MLSPGLCTTSLRILQRVEHTGNQYELRKGTSTTVFKDILHLQILFRNHEMDDCEKIP